MLPTLLKKPGIGVYQQSLSQPLIDRLLEKFSQRQDHLQYWFSPDPDWEEEDKGVFSAVEQVLIKYGEDVPSVRSFNLSRDTGYTISRCRKDQLEATSALNYAIAAPGTNLLLVLFSLSMNSSRLLFPHQEIEVSLVRPGLSIVIPTGWRYVPQFQVDPVMDTVWISTFVGLTLPVDLCPTESN